MNKVEQLTSAQAIERLLSLVTYNGPILDVTYGNGKFWDNTTHSVVGCDLNPERAHKVCCSFFDLPFKDDAFEMVVYDPPFHPFVNSHEEARFSGMGRNSKELKAHFEMGLLEAWRVTSRFLIVKCQDYVHSHYPLWMPLWCVKQLGEPYEWLIGTRPSKIVSGRWTSIRSLRRNHADYLMFCKQGNYR